MEEASWRFLIFNSSSESSGPLFSSSSPAILGEPLTKKIHQYESQASYGFAKTKTEFNLILPLWRL